MHTFVIYYISGDPGKYFDNLFFYAMLDRKIKSRFKRSRM